MPGPPKRRRRSDGNGAAQRALADSLTAVPAPEVGECGRDPIRGMRPPSEIGRASQPVIGTSRGSHPATHAIQRGTKALPDRPSRRAKVVKIASSVALFQVGKGWEFPAADAPRCGDEAGMNRQSRDYHHVDQPPGPIVQPAPAHRGGLIRGRLGKACTDECMVAGFKPRASTTFHHRSPRWRAASHSPGWRLFLYEWGS